MPDSNKKLPLVATEIAGLWTTYEINSLSLCMHKHFLKNVDDKKTKALIQEALELSEKHNKDISNIFSLENIPTPLGFGESDVNLDAPRLFTDTFYLFYLSNMASFGIDGYSLITRYVARSDIRRFFQDCIAEAGELYGKVVDLCLEQGTYIRSPRVEFDKKVSFIEKDTFLQGILKKPRPITAREITNAFSGILIDVMWQGMCEAFGQTTSSKKVKDFCFEGRNIASVHRQKFSDLLFSEHLPVPSFSESFVTDSTTQTFSDRLIMQHILILCNFAFSVDAVAIASSLRSDLIAIHTQYGAEIAKYASKGMDIMIENKWLEQPPQAVRHEELATV